MSQNMRRIAAVAALTAWCLSAPARADYARQVDLKNVSGQAKTDWPVVLRVCTVFGRNLDPSRLGAYRITGPDRKEVPHRVIAVPPADQPGNDEIVFVIPRIAAGQTLSYRIATRGQAQQFVRIDLVNGPHNLIRGGGFEATKDDRPANFSAPALSATKVSRSGRSLMLDADGKTVSTKYAKKIPLHKGSWYYFGVWSTTDGVARFGYQARGGGHFRLTFRDPASNKDVPAFDAGVTPQCSTRDWVKCTFDGGPDAWGVDQGRARARGPETSLEFVLQQRRHFYMDKAKTRGTWWLDDAVLMEQPEVTVRHDLALKPLVKDGVFVFTRPPAMPLGFPADPKRKTAGFCAMPHAHEVATSLDRSAAKGQRVSYCIGVYHTRPAKDVTCRVAGGALSAGDAKLPVELIEYCPGYLGADASRYMKVLFEAGGKPEPVTLAGDKGVRYFFVTFHVAPGTRAGKYTGKVELAEGGKVFKAVALACRVQDLAYGAPTGRYVGIILQGGKPPFNDASMKVYSRSGFTSVTRFGGFFSYSKDAKGNWQIDLDKLNERMMWMKKYGMEAVCVFSDFDLGPKWNGGTLLKRVRPAEFNQSKDRWPKRLDLAEAAYKAQIKRIETARKAHPEWPALIYMTWDEPSLGGGRNGKPAPAMGWVNQVAPKAITTLDIQFAPLPVCLKWYTCPAFDDPASWAGPEIYRWILKQGKGFGYCGSVADKGNAARYQPGMLMIASGGTFFHAWHLGRPQAYAGQMTYDRASKRVLRAVSMINWSDGMNDLKAHCLLTQAIADAKKASDATRRAAARAAETYLRGVRAVFNGDHKPTWPNEPYLGWPSDWGNDRFFDDWQEAMLKHAAAVKGVNWID